MYNVIKRYEDLFGKLELLAKLYGLNNYFIDYLNDEVELYVSYEAFKLEEEMKRLMHTIYWAFYAEIYGNYYNEFDENLKKCIEICFNYNEEGGK